MIKLEMYRTSALYNWFIDKNRPELRLCASGIDKYINMSKNGMLWNFDIIITKTKRSKHSLRLDKAFDGVEVDGNYELLLPSTNARVITMFKKHNTSTLYATVYVK